MDSKLNSNKYIPNELNDVFCKANKQIQKSLRLIISEFSKNPDYSILESQIEIILEKFAHDMLKTLVETKSKFAQLPNIARNITINNPNSLQIIVFFCI